MIILMKTYRSGDKFELKIESWLGLYIEIVLCSTFYKDWIPLNSLDESRQ